MAEKKATLWITLKEDVSAALHTLEGAVQGIRQSWLAVTGAIAGVVAIGIEMVRSFSEQEASVNKLNVALKNQGFYSKAYSDDLVKMAVSLQSVTAFSDESIIQTQSLLTTFGLAGNQLKVTTKAALDLSTGLGIDLRTATLILGKAWSGETATLSRYGIKINETLYGAEKFQAVLAQVNSRFGGSAEAALNTYSGRVANLSNKFSELREVIGSQLMPVAEAWLNWIDRAISGTNRLVASNDENLVGRKLTIAAMSREIAEIEQFIGRQRRKEQDDSDFTKAQIERMGKLREAREREINLLKDEKVAAEAGVKSKPSIDYETEKAIGQARLAARLETIFDLDNLDLDHLETEKQMQEARVEAYLMAENEIEKARRGGILTAVEFEKAHLANGKKLQEQSVKDTVSMYNQRKQVIAASLASIATLGNAKNKEIAAIGKAAGIALTLMHAHEGAGMALAKIPFPFGFIAAALVEAAGVAQAAQIAGIPVAQGGMVLPTQGGVSLIAGEAGRAEAVIPLNDPRTKEALKDTVGGGDTIHLHIGTLIADQIGLEAFVKRVDQELFRLKRHRMSVSV